MYVEKSNVYRFLKLVFDPRIFRFFCCDFHLENAMSLGCILVILATIECHSVHVYCIILSNLGQLSTTLPVLIRHHNLRESFLYSWNVTRP